MVAVNYYTKEGNHMTTMNVIVSIFDKTTYTEFFTFYVMSDQITTILKHGKKKGDAGFVYNVTRGGNAHDSEELDEILNENW